MGLRQKTCDFIEGKARGKRVWSPEIPVRLFIESPVVVRASEQDNEDWPSNHAEKAAETHDCSKETVQFPQPLLLIRMNLPPPPEHYPCTKCYKNITREGRRTADDAARASAEHLRRE